MKRISYTFILCVYLLSGLFYIPGDGKISLFADSSFSSKKSKLKTSYISSARIPKHVPPVSKVSVDGQFLNDDLSGIIKNTGQRIFDYNKTERYKAPSLLFPTNKAPPTT